MEKDVSTAQTFAGSTYLTSSAENATSPSVKNEVHINIFEQGIISGESFRHINFYFNYVATISCFVGTVFSVINIIIYLQQNQHRRTTAAAKGRPAHVLFLVAVCFGDGVYTIAKSISTFYNILFPAQSQIFMYLHICSNIYVAVSLRRVAITINALASLERFCVIAFPMTRALSFLQRRPHLVIGVVAICTCVAHGYIFVEYKVVPTGTGTYTLKRTEFANEHLDELLNAKTVIRSIFFYAPLLLSLVVNFALMVALRKHVASKQSIRTTKGGASDAVSSEEKSKTNTSAELQVARFILIFTLTFVLLALPATLNYTIGRFHPVYSVLKKEHYLLNTVSNMLDIPQFLTQLAIFLVSMRYNQRFRDSFGALLNRLKPSRCRSGSRDSDGILSNSSDVSSGVTRQSSG